MIAIFKWWSSKSDKKLILFGVIIERVKHSEIKLIEIKKLTNLEIFSADIFKWWISAKKQSGDERLLTHECDTKTTNRKIMKNSHWKLKGYAGWWNFHNCCMKILLIFIYKRISRWIKNWVIFWNYYLAKKKLKKTNFPHEIKREKAFSWWSRFTMTIEKK